MISETFLESYDREHIKLIAEEELKRVRAQKGCIPEWPKTQERLVASLERIIKANSPKTA
jgi:hypothetical protein